MNFNELESLMSSRGVTTLAEIARALHTTPQAVSNWKSRNQVPYHVVAKINQSSPQAQAASLNPVHSQFTRPNEDTISFSDILVAMAEQIKIILLVPFITVFLTLTYVKFIKQPQYVSWATILLPENKSSGGLGGLAGFASQFGVNVNVPTGTQIDLSSPSLFPELIRSRRFAEKILDEMFYINKYDRRLSLLSILTHGDEPTNFGRDTLIVDALNELNKIISFQQNLGSSINTIRVTAFEPVFAKELAEIVLSELEALNRSFKSQHVNEKTIFIENRIASVEDDLEYSEQQLKAFNEQNRLASSPALKLEQERLARDVEIQKEIYLTLKQQLELAKIEEVQETSILQILDKPEVALGPSNINLKNNVMLAGILGIILGIMIGFVRTYISNSNKDERKKIRRIKSFLNKKGKDLLMDRRITGIISILLFFGLPFYLGHRSQNPVFFGMYSGKYMLVNIVYILTLLFSSGLFIYRTLKNNR